MLKYTVIHCLRMDQTVAYYVLQVQGQLLAPASCATGYLSDRVPHQGHGAVLLLLPELRYGHPSCCISRSVALCGLLELILIECCLWQLQRYMFAKLLPRQLVLTNNATLWFQERCSPGRDTDCCDVSTASRQGLKAGASSGAADKTRGRLPYPGLQALEDHLIYHQGSFVIGSYPQYLLSGYSCSNNLYYAIDGTFITNPPYFHYNPRVFSLQPPGTRGRVVCVCVCVCVAFPQLGSPLCGDVLRDCARTTSVVT